ncbi:hypothetical protein V8F33_001293 [Rhypophila sp. PSN 637]
MAGTRDHYLRLGEYRCIQCIRRDRFCLNWPGKPCFSCLIEQTEDCELADEPRSGQNTENPADIPDSSNRTARATPVNQPPHGADIRFSPPPSHPRQQPEATASRDPPEDTDSEFEKGVKWAIDDFPLVKFTAEWNRERERERNRTVAQAQPTDHEIPRLITLDTRAKDENFSPAGIRYMKHHLNIFVDHLKTLGFDTSKINMDSPLGIPRVDPRFLPATQNQHPPVDNSDHQQKKRKDEGGDDADDGNGGESPSKRARV